MQDKPERKKTNFWKIIGKYTVQCIFQSFSNNWYSRHKPLSIPGFKPTPSWAQSWCTEILSVIRNTFTLLHYRAPLSILFIKTCFIIFLIQLVDPNQPEITRSRLKTSLWAMSSFTKDNRRLLSSLDTLSNFASTEKWEEDRYAPTSWTFAEIDWMDYSGFKPWWAQWVR